MVRTNAALTASTVALIIALAGPAWGQANKAPMDVNVVNTVKTVNVLPTKPFQSSVNGAGYRSLGPGSSATLGVSTITLTNLSSATTTVFVFAPVFASGATCGSTDITGGGAPRFYVVVPGMQTVHLTYPVPLVFSLLGQSCVAFSGGDNLDISVSGLTN